MFNRASNAILNMEFNEPASLQSVRKVKMNNEKLIEHVRNYPCIYNQNDKQYSDVDKKQAAWREISKKMNQPFPLCKKQWNNLRDAFRRSIKRKKETKSGQGSSCMKKWKYEEDMIFLLPFLKERDTSVAPMDHHFDDDDGKDMGSDTSDEMNQSIFNEGNDSPLPPPLKKAELRKCEKNASSVFMDYFLKNNNPHEEKSNSPDDIDLFFGSIASTVKRFTPYNRAIAKAKVFSIISELEIKNLSRMERITPVGQTPMPSPSSALMTDDAEQSSRQHGNPGAQQASQRIAQSHLTSSNDGSNFYQRFGEHCDN